MCPEASTLSAYYDDELEGAAYSAVEEHVSFCETCRAKLDEFAGLSTTLSNPLGYDLSVLSHRARTHIETRAAMAGPAGWYRTVRVPTPVAMFAALLLFILSLGLLLTRQQQRIPGTATAAVTGNTLSDIVQLLETRQLASQVVTFQLPENAVLRIFDEPVFVRAPESDRIYK